MWNGEDRSSCLALLSFGICQVQDALMFYPESQAYAIHVWLSGLDWLSYSAMSKSGTYLQNLLVMGETRSKLMIQYSCTIHDLWGEQNPYTQISVMLTEWRQARRGRSWPPLTGREPWLLVAPLLRRSAAPGNVSHQQKAHAGPVQRLHPAAVHCMAREAAYLAREYFERLEKKEANGSRICRKASSCADSRKNEVSLPPTNPAVRGWWWQGAINAEVYAKQDAASYVRKVGPEGYKSNGCFS